MNTQDFQKQVLWYSKLVRLGVYSLILQRNEDICTQAQEYFRIDPSLTTLTILQNPWEYKPDRRYDAILVLDREDVSYG